MMTPRYQSIFAHYSGSTGLLLHHFSPFLLPQLLCRQSRTRSVGVVECQHPARPLIQNTARQLKTLAGWLKALARKVFAALRGIIGAIVSWLLKTAGKLVKCIDLL